MTEMEWTNRLVIRLMQEYAKRPELWDTTNELYRVQTARYEAWSDLAGLFECDIAELRKKLNSIFASHRREKAKVRLGGKSSWFLYPYMNFLPTHLQNSTNDSVVETSTHQEIEELEQQSSDEDNNANEEQDEIVHEEIIIKTEPQTVEYVRPRKRLRYAQATHKPRLTKFARKAVKDNTNNNSNLDSKVLETLSLLRRSDLTRKKDECDSFGEYIAISLRKHDERTQSMIKQAINNILFEQEMKKYSVGQYAVVISGVDENPLILSDDK
ncbi:uncharacterized protein LOC134653865 [Cydia amplana]|uniref:uncharacterized protein LOC134653865 n=1 Tax=Cydia amplana TaxID=1869771 RepID=UPI002FE5D841